MYENIQTILETIYNLPNFISFIFKCIFIIFTAYIVTQKIQVNIKKNASYVIINIIRIISKMLLIIYFGVYIFFDYFMMLEVYDGIMNFVYLFCDLYKIVGFLVMIFTIIFTFFNCKRKKNTSKITIIVTNFSIALLYIFSKQIWKIIFAIIF